ncbi:hypothetical protein [Nocardioides currus]|nr:hypothetical protein [Nocardioides currus]
MSMPVFVTVPMTMAMTRAGRGRRDEAERGAERERSGEGSEAADEGHGGLQGTEPAWPSI